VFRRNYILLIIADKKDIERPISRRFDMKSSSLLSISQTDIEEYQRAISNLGQTEMVVDSTGINFSGSLPIKDN
jgi:hypothetical protein